MRLSLLASILFAAAFACAETDGTIRSLGDLNAALRDEAARSDPFEVECLVTDGPSALADTFSATDGSTYMEMTDGAFWPRRVLKDGDRIRAMGRIIRQGNDLYNYAKAFKIEIISHEEPLPPIEATAREINEGKVLNRKVRATGTIIDICRDEIDPRFVYFLISSGKEIIYANAYCTNDFDRASGFVGATVAVTGKCFTLSPGNNRFNLGPQISTTIPSGITIVNPGPADTFLAPVLEGGVADVSRALESDSPWRKVRGTVIAVWHRTSALVRVNPRRVSRVEFVEGKAPRVGETIEAVGIPETDIYNLNLSRARWRKVLHNDTQAGRHDPLAQSATPENVTIRFLLADERGRREFKPPYHGRLVRLIGIVQNIADLGDNGVRATIGDRGFDLPIELGDNHDIETGCKVEVTGVCVMATEPKSAHAPFPRTNGVFIVPRSADDVRVLARPPWWTPARLTVVIGALVLLMIAVIAWNVLLRKVSDRKGRDLAAARFANSVSELKVSERTRLATELHDSIVQNMTGAAMKLRAANKLFEANPEESRRQLGLALRTLDSSRDEIRNCIWDLRNQALDDPTMDESLRRVLVPHIGDAKLAVRFAVPRERLTDNAAHAIICVIRELAINAVRHGKAQSIQVAGCIEGGKLLFSVKDDGCGFDAQNVPGPESGHFGLQGVQERIEAFNGTLSLDSVPGKGTTATATLELKEKL